MVNNGWTNVVKRKKNKRNTTASASNSSIPPPNKFRRQCRRHELNIDCSKKGIFEKIPNVILDDMDIDCQLVFVVLNHIGRPLPASAIKKHVNWLCENPEKLPGYIDHEKCVGLRFEKKDIGCVLYEKSLREHVQIWSDTQKPRLWILKSVDQT